MASPGEGDGRAGEAKRCQEEPGSGVGQKACLQCWSWPCSFLAIKRRPWTTSKWTLTPGEKVSLMACSGASDTSAGYSVTHRSRISWEMHPIGPHHGSRGCTHGWICLELMQTALTHSPSPQVLINETKERESTLKQWKTSNSSTNTNLLVNK